MNEKEDGKKSTLSDEVLAKLDEMLDFIKHHPIEEPEETPGLFARFMVIMESYGLKIESVLSKTISYKLMSPSDGITGEIIIKDMDSGPFVCAYNNDGVLLTSVPLQDVNTLVFNRKANE